MSAPARLLDVLNDVANDRPFKTILAVTFTFDPEFFTSTGVLPALAGELDRTVATDDRAIEVARKERRRRVDSDVVRDRLGDPYIAVVQGYPSPSGPTPGWIDRYLWPTRRAGVLHAKCLLVAGEARAHAVITSANITEGSWCNNLEVAAAWWGPL
jgi:phosphatidylserine/phosphatidylglycerophosphate/cardiolipin synthase-like enzyme